MGAWFGGLISCVFPQYRLLGLRGLGGIGEFGGLVLVVCGL